MTYPSTAQMCVSRHAELRATGSVYKTELCRAWAANNCKAGGTAGVQTALSVGLAGSEHYVNPFEEYFKVTPAPPTTLPISHKGLLWPNHEMIQLQARITLCQTAQHRGITNHPRFAPFL